MPITRGTCPKTSGRAHGDDLTGAGTRGESRRVISADMADSPNGCPRRDSAACLRCLGMPTRRAQEESQLQSITPLATIASPPEDSMHCLRMLAAGEGIGPVRRTITSLR